MESVDCRSVVFFYSTGPGCYSFTLTYILSFSNIRQGCKCLLHYRINYGSKKFYSTGHGCNEYLSPNRYLLYGAMIFSITTLSKMIFSIMTVSIKGLLVTLSLNDTHKAILYQVPLCFVSRFIYTVCRYVVSWRPFNKPHKVKTYFILC
jgi:hypothetical protein